MNNNDIVARKILLVILWSYGLYILMYLHQYLGTFIAARVSGKSFEAIISGEFKNYQTELIIGLTAVFIGISLVFLVTRFLWRRSFEWIRLQFNFKYLLFGLLLGFIVPFVVILILKILGFAEIAWSQNLLQSKEATAIIISYACMAIFSGIAEEVVYRGMAVREIAVRNGWLVAVIIGGVYFGAAHLVSKLSSITLTDAFWIILASIPVTFLFVALYIRSQSLWLPIGFHMAWNFCLKGIMGITMSGNVSEVGLLNVELTGNAFLTGGNFGIETSIVSSVIYILIAFLFIRFPWHGHITFLSNK